MKNITIVTIAIFFTLASAAGVIIIETEVVETYAQAGQTSNNATKTLGHYGNLNITGSIPLGPTIMESIRSQIHTNLSQAISIAQQAIGQNSSVIGANLHPVNAFLVYAVIVVGNNATHYVVLVDAGDGKVLSTQSHPLGEGSSAMTLSFGHSSIHPHSFGYSHGERSFGNEFFPHG